jgi:ABC-2 type transport system permease protein
VDKFLLKMIKLFRAVFLKQGIDFERMVAIVETKLTMDKRRVYMNWRQSQQKENRNHLNMILFSYLFFGLIFGILIFFVPSFLLSMIMMHAYVLFMMAMTMITDFSTVLLDTTDNQVILPRPVSGKTLFMARLVHIFIYLLQFTIALSFFPWLFTFIKYGWLTGAGFIITVLLTVLLAVFITYFLYLLILRFSSEEKVKEVVTYFQIFMTIFFALGYQVIPRLINLKQLSYDFTLHWYSYLLPPVWMAVALETLQSFRFDVVHVSMICLAVVVPVFAFWIMNKYLAPSFARKLSAVQTEGNVAGKKRIDASSNKSLPDSLSHLLCRSKAEKSTFEMTWKITGRDKAFRLQFYPGMAYILVFVFIFVFNGGRDMELHWQGLPGSNRFLWFIYLPMFTISSSIIIVAFNENYQASWVYHSLPVSRPGELVLGSIKALFVKYFVPVYVLMFAFCFYIWGISIADDFAFGLFNNLLCYLIFATLSDHYLPFSRQPNTRQQSGRFLIVILQMIIVSALVGVHYLVLPQSWFIYGLMPVMIICCLLLMRNLQQLPWEKIAV